MNNSIARLIDGMVATLRNEVIPATSGEFARGQAFGVIYMLESMKLRTQWSDAYSEELDSAASELCLAVSRIQRPEGLGEPGGTAALADAWASEAYDAIDQADDDHEPLRNALDAYVHRCLRHEIKTSARPMFAEMSLGREENL